MITKIFNKVLLESDQAFKELQMMIKGDKEIEKLKKSKLNVIDYIYTTYEKEITKIEKKYNLGMDELAELLMEL